MKLSEFDCWVRERLEFDVTDGVDTSMNGVQAGDMNMDVSRVGFAVDACMDSLERACAEGAQMLFVHHGLFWGPAVPLTGVTGERIRFLMKNDMALYACHLPLDRHLELGNNAQMALILGMESLEPFGEYKGRCIGMKGLLPNPLSMEAVVECLFGFWDEKINVLRFGKKQIRSIGIISGGGTREVSQAIAQGLDLYVTGDSSHSIYHECREAGINVLFAGHYLTEIFGVRAMAKEVRDVLELETLFLDIPTGY